MLRTEGPVFVIGAVNTDITGDSGLNIAENLRLLGRKVSMVTAVGAGEYGHAVCERCRKAGIDLQFAFSEAASAGSSELLLPARLEPLLPVLNKGAMMLVDANLPAETLCWIAQHIEIPLAADPVSGTGAKRLRPLLSGLTLFGSDVPEAEMLTGMEIRGDRDPGMAADALHQIGVRRVYIFLGERGVWADDTQEGGRLVSCYPGATVNTIGCRDAFMACAADAFLSGMGTHEAAERALAASAVLNRLEQRI